MTTRVVSQPRPVTPMSILVSRLGDLIELVEDGDVVVRTAVRNAYELAAGLDPYLERCSTPASPALRALAGATAGHDWSGHDGPVAVEQEMLSGHVEGALLQMLVHATRARRVLDIGMFTGYSALAMAEALPPDGRVVACELDPEVAAFAERMFHASPAGGRISVRVGPAADTLAGLAGTTYDLVFVDADKVEYAEYVEQGLRLLRHGGVLAVDNTLWHDRAADPANTDEDTEAIRSALNAVQENEDLIASLLPVGDGLLVAVKL
jgi:predicted O-methyltransferase YrrM